MYNIVSRQKRYTRVMATRLSALSVNWLVRSYVVLFKLHRLGMKENERHSRKSDEHVIWPVDVVVFFIKTAIHFGVKYGENTGPVGIVRLFQFPVFHRGVC